MVKVSGDELNNFYIPIPPIKKQQNIVDEIETELDKQKIVKKKNLLNALTATSLFLIPILKLI